MVSNQSRVQKVFVGIARLVPGYKSYSEKEYLRSNDTLLRKITADALRSVQESIKSSKRTFLSSGDLDSVGELSRLETECALVESICISAKRGYSAVFQEDQINEDRLLQILEFDRGHSDIVDKLRSLASKDIELTDLSEIKRVTRLCKAALDQRENLLRGS
jgi:hypothetical protein